MQIRGRVWCLGDSIDTDKIIGGQYLSLNSEEELAQHCFESMQGNWSGKIKGGDILVAGKNFGCGSSREHAAIALKGLGVACIIAESYGSIFFRNAINLGMNLIELPRAMERFSDEDIAEVDMTEGSVTNISTGKRYTFGLLPPMLMKIMETGGLLPYVKKYRYST